MVTEAVEEPRVLENRNSTDLKYRVASGIVTGKLFMPFVKSM
jgi:hypothetical protein